MAHILDKDIRCFRAIRVRNKYSCPTKANLQSCQSLDKHLYFHEEHFLMIIIMGVQYKGFLPGAVQQLKLLHRVNTPHFLHPTVDVSPYFNGPK